MATWQSHAYQLLTCPLGWQRVVSFDLLGESMYMSLSIAQFITWGTLKENWPYPNQVPTIWNAASLTAELCYGITCPKALKTLYLLIILNDLLRTYLWLIYRIPTRQSCKTVILRLSFLTDDFPWLNKVFTLHYITFVENTKIKGLSVWARQPGWLGYGDEFCCVFLYMENFSPVNRDEIQETKPLEIGGT